MSAKKRLLKMLAVLLLPLFASGCGPDLGVFEKKGLSEYYDSFGEVEALYDGGSKSYDVENSLYNKKTLDDFSWEKDEYKVEDQEYLYIIVPFKVELKIQAIVICFRSLTTVNLKLSCFYFQDDSSAPQKIKYLSSPDTEIVEEEEVEIEYDDPPVENAIMTGETTLKTGKWTSLVLDKFQQAEHDDNYLYTNDNGLLYIRVENNSGFNRDTMESFTFSFTNFMVRAVEEGE